MRQAISKMEENIDEAFARLDKERLLEITYLSAGCRIFRGDRQNFLSFLNTLRKQGDSGFCDVVLEVDGQSFPAHRCVLAANSQFFYTMFTSGMRDSKEKHIKLCSLSSSSLSTILDFFYTREVAINRDNAEDLLEAASFLLLNHVKSACASIISTNLSISNCFSTRRLADKYSLEELKKKSDSFTKENFQRAKQESDFLSLSCAELYELISSDGLRVEKEEEVFEALLNWVRHDPANRAKDLSSLLPCLRFGSLSVAFLEEQIQKERLLQDCSFCQNFLKQQRRRRRTSRAKREVAAKERPSAKIHNVVVGVGRGNLHTSFCFDVEEDVMYRLPEPPSPSFQLGVAIIGRDLYSVSRDRHDWDDSATRLMMYSLGQTHKTVHYWYEKNGEIESPSVCLDKTHVVSLKGKLYTLGGCSVFVDRHAVVQCYDPVENAWKTMAQLLTPRCMLGVVTTEFHLYAIGGKTSHASLPEQLVERYDPEANYWTPVAPLNTHRASPKVVATGENIFVLGGLHIGAEVSCEVYKEVSDQWSNIASLPSFSTPKLTFALNKEVYILYSNETYRYDKKKNSWKKSLLFKSLREGFEDFSVAQLQLPKFCFEHYTRIAPQNLASFGRSFYECSSDDDDDDDEEEEESDYHPWFFWGDDSSGSDW